MELTKEQKLAQFWKHNINPITGWVDQPIKERYILNTSLKGKEKRRLKRLEFIESIT
jgi:hypothetical protein